MTERCACGALSGFECTCDAEIIAAMHYSGALAHDPFMEAVRLAMGIALLSVGVYFVGAHWLSLILKPHGTPR